MKAPRKIYIVISKTVDRNTTLYEIFISKSEADAQCKRRNDIEFYGASDWRVETYVKGG